MELLAAPLVFAPDSMPSAQIGIPYSQDITVSNGVAPYSFASEGSLIAGLAFQSISDGVMRLHGTPSQQSKGLYPFKLISTDSTGTVTEKQY